LKKLKRLNTDTNILVILILRQWKIALYVVS